jgi:hypothetical protein
MLGVVAPLLQT